MGISSTAPVSIEGCETVVTRSHDAAGARQLAAAHPPDQIVLCGAAGDSAWHHVNEKIASRSAIESARAWTKAASELGIPVTLISSDAIFTGPWMFHAETSISYSRSTQADALRTLESFVREQCPKASSSARMPTAGARLREKPGGSRGLSLPLNRTGPASLTARPTERRFSPRIWPTSSRRAGNKASRASITSQARNGSILTASCVPGAGVQPVVASVKILDPVESAVAAFGQGETSLRTEAIRRAVSRPMPMLVEGLKRLFEQKTDGFDRRFRGSRRLRSEQGGMRRREARNPK